MKNVQLFLGDCLDTLKTLEDNSVDSIVTDPPYGLSFMGKKWDYDVPSVEIWKQCLRVLKPGGHLLSFGGTRTYHRLVVNIEDAGFEIRDCIQWNHGQGFPKSTSIKKSGINQGVFCGCEDSNNMSGVSNSKNNLEVLEEEDKNTNLIKGMQRETPLSESNKIQQQWDREEETRNRTKARKESGLERRDNLQEEQRKLYRSEICEMSEGFPSDGEKGWLHNGTSIDTSSEDRPFVVSDRGCSSPRPQYSKQSDRELGTLAKQQKSQVSRTWSRCPVCDKPIFPEDSLGTALKPANEPICVARKPLEKGLTVAENILKYGTGALNIDECRIAPQEKDDYGRSAANSKGTINAHDGFEGKSFKISEREGDYASSQGRWPANIILDEEAAAALDEQSGQVRSSGAKSNTQQTKSSTDLKFMGNATGIVGVNNYNDKGGASRFFYVAKASKKDRGEGNVHSTVKPTKLMSYLIKLVTPPNGIVLDPFMGSGSTGVAAVSENYNFIGCEMDESYLEIARKRINE
jgi:DNA modification methylase